MRRSLFCFVFAAIVLAGNPISVAAFAQDITIEGKTFYKDGKPWILKGVDVAGLSKSPHQRAKDKGAAQAKDYWVDAERKATKQVLGVDTLRLQMSPAGLDPQSSDYDPNYITELHNNIASVRKMDFAVILVMDAQQDHPIGSPEGCMPSDSAVRAWKTIAPSFVHDRGIMFELFDEPCKWDKPEARQEWVRGMQRLIDAVRGTGSQNILLLDGLWYARQTNGLFPLVHDNLRNRMALAVHPYLVKGVYVTEKQWRDMFGASAAQYPMIATEWNAVDGCVGDDLPGLALTEIRYLQSLHIGLVGWGIDSNYGKLVMDHEHFEPIDYRNFHGCVPGAKEHPAPPGDWGAGKLLANFPNN